MIRPIESHLENPPLRLEPHEHFARAVWHAMRLRTPVAAGDSPAAVADSSSTSLHELASHYSATIIIGRPNGTELMRIVPPDPQYICYIIRAGAVYFPAKFG